MNRPDQNQQNGFQPTNIELYKIAFAKLNQEGDGIWSRFNFMMSINLGLAGGFLLVFKDFGQQRWQLVALQVIGFFGLSMCISMLLILSRLWQYQNHWAKIVRNMEAGFPPGDAGWPRILSNRAPRGISVRTLVLVLCALFSFCWLALNVAIWAPIFGYPVLL